MTGEGGQQTGASARRRGSVVGQSERESRHAGRREKNYGAMLHAFMCSRGLTTPAPHKNILSPLTTGATWPRDSPTYYDYSWPRVPRRRREMTPLFIVGGSFRPKSVAPADSKPRNVNMQAKHPRKRQRTARVESVQETRKTSSSVTSLHIPAETGEVLRESRLVRLDPVQHGLVVLPVRAERLTGQAKQERNARVVVSTRGQESIHMYRQSTEPT